MLAFCSVLVRTYVQMLSIIIDFCASSPSIPACSVRCTHCKLAVKVLKGYLSCVQNLIESFRNFVFCAEKALASFLWGKPTLGRG